MIIGVDQLINYISQCTTMYGQQILRSNDIQEKKNEIGVRRIFPIKPITS